LTIKYLGLQLKGKMRGKGKLWKHSGFRREISEFNDESVNPQGQSQRIKVNRGIKINFLCFFTHDPLRLSLPTAAGLSTTNKKFLCV